MKKKMNLVGPQVRRLRYQQGLTQPDLVRRCQLLGWDLSRESLAKIESCLRGVTDFELIGLSLALQIPYHFLLPAKKELKAAFKTHFTGKDQQ